MDFDPTKLTSNEILRLKQLVCDHEPDDSLTSSKCFCCGNVHDAQCKICGVHYDETEDCHDPDDPDYPCCSSCN